MSTDRELLEKAAKAAGLPTDPDGFHPTAGFVWIRRSPQRSELRWNPLTDDGDAFRLAVDLGFSLEIHHDLRQPLPWLRIVDREKNWTHAGPGGAYEEDRLASTRRAIVRAAAALGDQP